MSARLDDLEDGGKLALAKCLARLEAAPFSADVLALLDQAFGRRRAHVLGLTGPPGVGKSSLITSLIRDWREQGERVAIVAVDPSSRRTGGAILGDRTRFELDPDDPDIFVRSMAARERLGGLAALTMPVVTLFSALFDRVVVETVGVGQSETAIAGIADTVLFAAQPGSGDSLQYMKAGIAEIPDIALVTKADLGELAIRAASELERALALDARQAGWRVRVMPVSSIDGSGMGTLMSAIEAHRLHLVEEGRLGERRARQARAWLEETVLEEFGRRGLARLGQAGIELLGDPSMPPYKRFSELEAALTSTLAPPARSGSPLS